MGQSLHWHAHECAQLVHSSIFEYDVNEEEAARRNEYIYGPPHPALHTNQMCFLRLESGLEKGTRAINIGDSRSRFAVFSPVLSPSSKRLRNPPHTEPSVSQENQIGHRNDYVRYSHVQKVGGWLNIADLPVVWPLSVPNVCCTTKIQVRHKLRNSRVKC